MDKIGIVLQAIKTGIAVASFLLNTSRILEAIAIFKECLILLNNKCVEKKQELLRSFHIEVHARMFKGYILINDLKRAIECGKQFLILLHEYGELHTEGTITFKMAKLCESQAKYETAKDLYMRANKLAITTGQRKLAGAS